MSKDRVKKRKLSKHLKQAIILTIVFAVVISVMGVLNQCKNSCESANKVLKQKIEYVLGDVQEDDTGFSSEELYNYLTENYQNDKFVLDEGSYFLVYDINADKIYGTEQESELETKKVQSLAIVLQYTDFSYIPLSSSYYYIYDYNAGSKIIIEIPMSRINWSTAIAIRTGLLACVISAACILIFLLISLFTKLAEKNLLRVIKIIGTVWVCTAAVIFLWLNYSSEYYQNYASSISMLSEVNNDVTEIAAMTENEADAMYQQLCTDYPDTALLAEEKNYTDVRDKLLFMETYDLIQLELEQDNPIAEFYFKDNIWDTSLQITDRVVMMWDDQYIINNLIGNILQAIMFIALYVIIMSINRPSNEDKDGVVENASTRQLSRIVFLKNVADALMAVVAMAILTNIVKINFSADAAKQVVKWTLTGTGFASLIAVVMIPFVLKKLGSTKKFLILSFIVSIIGSIACMATKHIWIFLAGYLIITFTETVILLLRIMLPLQEEEKMGSGYDQGKFISNAGRVGSLFGMVSGGVVGSFLPARFIFFIITMLTIVCLILAIRMPKIEYKGFQFETGFIRKTVFQKSLIPVFLLIVIPFGFLSYCFKNIIPLNIANLGLTTTLVSFILFFRDACVYFFKQNNKTKKAWKIKDTHFNVIIGMIASAAVLAGIYFIQNIYIMLLLTLVMAFLQAGMSSQSRNLVYEETGSDDRKFFGHNFINSAGRQISRTIAPTIASVNVCLLAAVMAAGAVGYSLYLKLAKRGKGDSFLD